MGGGNKVEETNDNSAEFFSTRKKEGLPNGWNSYKSQKEVLKYLNMNNLGKVLKNRLSLFCDCTFHYECKTCMKNFYLDYNFSNLETLLRTVKKYHTVWFSFSSLLKKR